MRYDNQANYRISHRIVIQTVPYRLAKVVNIDGLHKEGNKVRKQIKQSMLILLTLWGMGLILSGCGHKGPLVLPKENVNYDAG